MGDFSPTKEHRDLDPLSPLDELTNVSYLVLDIMRIGAGAHLYFLDFEHRELLRSVRFLFLLVAELAVIHHPAHRRLCVRRDFQQIHLFRLYLFQRLVQRHDPELFALRTDDANFTGANLMIEDRKSTRLNSSHEWISY